MVKIVCTSDTHGFHRSLDIPPADILIHAGDIDPSFGGMNHLKDFNDWLGEIPCKHKIVIAGNHDTVFEARPDSAMRMIKKGRYIQNTTIEIEGLKIFGSPHTIPFAGAFNTPPKQIYEIWKKIPDDTDVVVTHGPPKMILDETTNWNLTKENCGDGYLFARIREIKPKLHVFGHIHEGYGIYKSDFGTIFVNASALNFIHNTINKPIVIDI